MEMINRAAVVVRPKQPFLDWAKLDDETGIAGDVIQDMHDDPTVFLVPEYEDEEDQQAILQKSWPILFEAMLNGWLQDPESWPKNLTFEMFQDWFEVQMMSIVRDLHRDKEIEYLE